MSATNCGTSSDVPLSAWEDELRPAPGAVPGDPRVARTQRHVLEHARRLLEEQGPAGLTFSALAAHAEVARQTLYRYWDSPEALVADLFRRRTLLPAAARPATFREALRCHLVGLRATLADPAATAALGMLMAAAGHVPAAADALRAVMDSRRQELNDRLAGLGAPLDEDDFLRLNGPLLSARFTGWRPISDRLIEDVVDSLCPPRDHEE